MGHVAVWNSHPKKYGLGSLIKDVSSKSVEDKDHISNGNGEDEGATTHLHEHKTLPSDEASYDETCAGLKGIKLDESNGPHGPVHVGDVAAKARTRLDSFGTRNMFEGDARPKDFPKQAHIADPSQGATSPRSGGMEESSLLGTIPPVHGAGIHVNKVSKRDLPPLHNVVVAGAPALSRLMGDHTLKVRGEGESTMSMDLPSDELDSIKA